MAALSGFVGGTWNGDYGVVTVDDSSAAQTYLLSIEGPALATSDEWAVEANGDAQTGFRVGRTAWQKLKGTFDAHDPFPSDSSHRLVGGGTAGS